MAIGRFFNTPVSEAAEKENSWRRYGAWLQKQIDEPMFAEAFGLSQVYIQPRAYYEQEIENNNRVKLEINTNNKISYNDFSNDGATFFLG